jgi:hypothetical protein
MHELHICEYLYIDKGDIKECREKLKAWEIAELNKFVYVEDQRTISDNSKIIVDLS